MSIESMIPSNHLFLCLPLLLLPSVFPTVRIFSNELALHIRWPNHWSFSISPSGEYSGLIFFRIDWFDLFAVQGTFRSLLQCHILKASILWHSSFFVVQLSQLYVTTEKTIALTIWTFVGRVMSLLFNMLSRLVITCLPRSKCLLISCLQSPSTVILEPKRIKSDTVSTVSPSISHEVMGPDAMIFSSVQFSSVTQLCPTLFFCNPMKHSMPGLPVHHQLPEFTQTHDLKLVSSKSENSYTAHTILVGKFLKVTSPCHYHHDSLIHKGTLK